MAKMSNGNGKMLKVGLVITLTGVVTTALVLSYGARGKQVAINTGDIKENKTVIRMVREEQAAGFKHLEKVIIEGRGR